MHRSAGLIPKRTLAFLMPSLSADQENKSPKNFVGRNWFCLWACFPHAAFHLMQFEAFLPSVCWYFMSLQKRKVKILEKIGDFLYSLLITKGAKMLFLLFPGEPNF